MNPKTPEAYWLAKAWHLPVVLMLGIYFPASLFGAYVFRDGFAASFLLLLGIFVVSYYALYSRCVALIERTSLRSSFWRIGDRLNWRVLTWLAIGLYIATLSIAAATTEVTPLGAALRGGTWLDIAKARGDLFANRQGYEALLRYSALIIGRSIMPFLITYLYWSGHKSRHWGLFALLLCYVVSLEKASPIFVFLPLILLSVIRGKGRQVLAHSLAMSFCIALWTFLAMGGLQREKMSSAYPAAQVAVEKQVALAASNQGFSIGRRGDPQRHYVFNFINAMGVPFNFATDGKDVIGRLLIISNRVLWIPYVTAYDWLRFQDEVLNGRLTMGQSIGVVSWLQGKPKLPLEQMVYEYEFGPPLGGAGASNTVFLVDAKLAFGWAGVLMYCVVFVFFSAIVFSSEHQVAKIASVTTFFTATLSPLTATLLSGGLFFYLAISLLVRTGTDSHNQSLQ